MINETKVFDRYFDGASVIIYYRHFHERVVDENPRAKSVLRRENVYWAIIKTCLAQQLGVRWKSLVDGCRISRQREENNVP